MRLTWNRCAAGHQVREEQATPPHRQTGSQRQDGDSAVTDFCPSARSQSQATVLRGEAKWGLLAFSAHTDVGISSTHKSDLPLL